MMGIAANVMSSTHEPPSWDLDVVERRRADRRARPTPALSRYSLWGGRRATVRRAEEREGAYVDRHDWNVVLVVLAVLGFNVIDAAATLFFIKEGAAIELNPVADWLMSLGDHVFVWAKTLGIGLILAFLLVSRNFRAARVGLWIVFAIYALLALYHGVLMALYLQHAH